MHIVMNGRSIKEWRQEERPREKMLERGSMALTDAELLAILLRTGNNEKSALGLARELLEGADNSLRNISNYSCDLITRISGIGPAKAVSLMAAVEIGRRAMVPQGGSEIVITDAKSALDVMAPLLAHLDHEECWALFLSRANRIIARERISVGGSVATVIDVKLVVKRAVERLASGIILIHNHPSGNAVPGEKDRRATQSLKKAAALLDIDLIDHIIVAGNKYFSFCEEEKNSRF